MSHEATPATTQETTPTHATTTQTLTGCVKWFNNGLNYGFITVLSDGEYRNTDVFVHQSNIRTARDCFRTLYTGECVQFELAKSDNEKHPFHAINVQGFNGVKLRCEAPRGTGFGIGRGNGRGRGGSRGFRGPRQTGANQQQSENSAVATQETKTADNESSTNAVESTQQTNAHSNVETTATSVEAVSSSASASGAKERGHCRKVSA